MACWTVADGQTSRNEIILNIDYNQRRNRADNLYTDEFTKIYVDFKNFWLYTFGKPSKDVCAIGNTIPIPILPLSISKVLTNTTLQTHPSLCFIEIEWGCWGTFSPKI